MQGWKKNQHPMGDVRVYNPTPPETTSSIDLRDYQFKMVELKVNGRESGLRKYEFSIRPKTRALSRGFWATKLTHYGVCLDYSDSDDYVLLRALFHEHSIITHPVGPFISGSNLALSRPQ